MKQSARALIYNQISPSLSTHRCGTSEWAVRFVLAMRTGFARWNVETTRGNRGVTTENDDTPMGKVQDNGCPPFRAETSQLPVTVNPRDTRRDRG